MTEQRTIIAPGREELLRRLTAIDGNEHLAERFYPLLLSYAGQEMESTGIVVAVTLSLAEYTEGLPPVLWVHLKPRVHEFASVFTDDPDMLAEVRSVLAAAGLPTD